MLICLRFGNRNALMLKLFLRSSPWPELRTSARRTWGMIGFGPKRTDDWRHWPWEGPTVTVALEVPPAGGNSRLGGTQENQLIPPCSSHQMSNSPCCDGGVSPHREKQWGPILQLTHAGFYFLPQHDPYGPLKYRISNSRSTARDEFRAALAKPPVPRVLGNGKGGWCSPWLFHQLLMLAPLWCSLRREAASLPKSCLVSVWLKTPGRPRSVLPDCPARERAGTEARQEAVLMRTGEDVGWVMGCWDPSSPEHVTSGGTTAHSPPGD